MLNQLVREGLENINHLGGYILKGWKMINFYRKVFLFRPSILTVARLLFSGKGSNSIKIINLLTLYSSFLLRSSKEEMELRGLLLQKLNFKKGDEIVSPTSMAVKNFRMLKNRFKWFRMIETG